MEQSPNKNNPEQPKEEFSPEEIISLQIHNIDLEIEKQKNRMSELIKLFHSNEIGYDQKDLEADKITFRIQQLEADRDKLLGVEKPRSTLLGRLAAKLTRNAGEQ